MYQAIPQTQQPSTPPQVTRSTSGIITTNQFSVNAKLAITIMLFILGLALVFPISVLASFLKHQLFPGALLPSPETNHSIHYLLDISASEFTYPDYGTDCKLTLYTYGASVPGPTIYLSPGQSFSVHVINRLEEESEDLQVDALGENQYHSPNTTSVHFHGVHVSPNEVDNVFHSIKPNASHWIHGRLLDDHPSGTFFVHPHLHGSAAFQMSFAMASPFIVLDKHQAWREIPEEILLLQIGGVDTNHAYSDARLAFTQNHVWAKQPTKAKCNAGEAFALVNGHIKPLHTPCDWMARRWRVIHAGTDGALVLQWRPTNEQCYLFEIARDGMYLARKRLVTELVLIPTGGRVDFIVEGDRCQDSKLESVPAMAPQWFGNKTNLFPAGVLAQCHDLQSSARAMPGKLPKPAAYVKSLMKYKGVRQRRVLEWTEFPSGSPVKYGINGESFDGSKAHFSVRLGHVEEWVIRNPYFESHPFHIHTNHFQIMGDSHGVHTSGEWRDTAFVPARGNLTVRWQAQHFTGKSMVHCHILQHEDLGMTWRIDILDAL